jgi:hypothetical protein
LHAARLVLLGREMRQLQLQLRIALAVPLALASCTLDLVQHAERSSQLRAVGQGIVPYQHPELWPLQLSSTRIVVHYRTADEQAMAEQVLGHVEHAWQVQIDAGGALPPLDDHGLAGPDGRFDVYLWRGVDEPYVVGVAPDDITWYDDTSTSMVVDPWGEYGGAELEANVFHELRHASQGSDDWWEHAHAFEAEATLWEAAYYGIERLSLAWEAYQAHPEWTLFRSDGYRTWYMYGGALFLLYLSEHAFGGDLAFSNSMWQRSRNAPGANVHPELNEPDFADALQDLLAAQGSSLFDQVLGFARARWYTGARANGSLPGGAILPEVAHGTHTRRTGARQTSFSASPQMLGTSYVVVERAATDPAALWVSLSTTSGGARFAVQTVGGAPADATLDLGAGPVQVSFGSGTALTFVVTALPADGVFDPDLVGTAQMTASLTLSTTR